MALTFLLALLVSGCGSSSTGGAGDGAAATAEDAPLVDPTEPPAAGGGGGGAGANGSITYEITGDVTKSGELPFVYLSGGVSQFVEGGWVIYFYSDATPDLIIQINSNPASNIVNYGDGEILVVGTEDSSCTFDYSKNDASGLEGTIDCPTTFASSGSSGALMTVQFRATVNAHT